MVIFNSYVSLPEGKQWWFPISVWSMWDDHGWPEYRATIVCHQHKPEQAKSYALN